MAWRLPSASGKTRGLSGFTLIELLTVIVIIGILAALTLYAFTGVLKQSARSRARTEMGALSAALESYKSDNGAYPPATVFNSTANYETSPTTSLGLYQTSSQILYQSLTGQKYYGDPPPTAATGGKIYFIFKRAQLGNDTTALAGNPIYVKDPFGNSYGYFTGSGTGATANVPNNGANFFDLWSTGGDTTGATPANWIDNWGS